MIVAGGALGPVSYLTLLVVGIIGVMVIAIIAAVVTLSVRSRRLSIPREAGIAAAGWYPDPQDHSAQRYWDGSAWNEHSHPGNDTRSEKHLGQ